jgi:SPP1 gp7 family putative phage head morphogenesis protein
VWLSRISAYYSQSPTCDHPEHNIPIVQAIDLSDWEKVFIEVATKMHSGELKPSDLDESLVLSTYKELSKATAEGYGKQWSNFETENLDPGVQLLKQNLFKFSGAKSYAMLLELNDKLTVSGKVVPFNDFKKAALAINEKYNLNHLQAEYQTAVQAGHHARNWSEFQRTKHLFPNLKYRTVGDGRVRDEHKKLDGIIAPIDSDFWRKYYPPNGWRCRCGVTQTAEAVSENIPTKVNDISPEFTNNVGAQNAVFNDRLTADQKPHPYFALAKTEPNQAALRLSFDRVKVETPSQLVHKSKKGAKVEMSVFADKVDLQENVKSAVIIADQLNLSTQIRPHLETIGLRNPEYTIDKVVADRHAGGFKTGFRNKTTQLKEFKSNFEKLFPEKNVNDDYAIVFDRTGLKDITVMDARFVNGRLKNGKLLSFVIVIRESKAIRINRDDTYQLLESKLLSLNAKGK